MTNEPPREDIAAMLARFRDEAGLTGMEAARRAGGRWSQSKISRLENRKQAPTVKDVTTLCKAYRVTPEERAAALALAKDLEPLTTSSRIILQNPGRWQNRIGRMEEASRLLRSFQTTLVIGQAQTPEYALAITEPDLEGEKREEAVQSRLGRQSILDSDREFVLVHTEGALRWHLVGPELMAAQLGHLVELSRRPNVRMGVIPWDRPTTTYARHTFHLYDSRAAIVTTETGMAVVTDPAQVKVYDKRFTELEAVSVFGDEARAVFRRLADEYRALRIEED